MANKPKNGKELEAKIIAHAWKDPRYKEKLLKNPRAALKEMGLDVPENIQIKVVEDKPDSFTFVLPSPVVGAKEMSDQELEKLAAGAGGTLFAAPTEERFTICRSRYCGS